MLLLIDNYDSFTYNLVHYFTALGIEVTVHYNDALTLADIEAYKPSHIVISPGPCTPNESGISLSVIKHFAGRIPLLGVCLGHQAIAQVFGAKIVRAEKIMHGKTSLIHHQCRGLFENIPQPFWAARYHSLVIDKTSLSDGFEVTAWTQDHSDKIEEIMAIQHRSWPLYGVQFHPESILTTHGKNLLQNFLLL